MAAPVHVEDVNLFALDTKTSPFLLKQGGLIRADNVVMVNGGRWQKRNGSAPLPTLPKIGALQWTDTFGTELLVGGASGQQMAWTPGTNGWLPKGSVQPISIESEIAVGGINDKTNVDLAINASFGSGNAFSCYGWIEDGNANFAVFDENGGQVMAPQTSPGLTASFVSVRVVSIGPFFVLVAMCATDLAGDGLFVVVIDPIQRTASTYGVSGSNAATCFDARAVALSGVGHLGQYVAVAWGTSQGCFATGFDPWTHGFCIPTVQVGIYGTSSICVTWGALAGATGGNTVAVMQGRPLGVSLVSFLIPGTLIEQTAQLVDTPIAGSNFGKMSIILQSPNWTCVYEETATAFTLGSLKVAQGGITGVTSAGYLKRNATLAGDLFASNDAIFALALYQGATVIDQPTFLLLEVATSGGTEVARIQQSNAGGVIQPIAGLPYINRPTSAPVPQWTGSCYGVALLTQSSASFDGAFVPARCVGRTTISWGAQPFSAQIGSDLHLSGGFLSMYDGEALVEHNFHVTPEPPIAWLCNIACCRAVVGTAGAPGTAEVDNIYFPPDLANPEGTLTGSGWQIKPGSYVIIGAQNTSTIAQDVAASGTLSATSGTGVHSGFAISAVTPGAAGNAISIVFVLSSVSGSSSCSVAGNVVTVNVAYGGDTLTNLYNLINSFAGTLVTAAPPFGDASLNYPTSNQFSPGPITTINLTGGIGAGPAAAYSGPAGYVYFTVDGIGQDPDLTALGMTGPSGAAMISVQCAVASTDTAQVVAGKFRTAVQSSALIGYVSAASPSQGTPPTSAGAFQTWLVALTTTAKSATSTGAGSPCVYSENFCADYIDFSGVGGTQITCPAGYRIAPGGYFVLPWQPNGASQPVNLTAFYFVVNGVGSAPNPAAIPLPTLPGNLVPTINTVQVLVNSWSTPQQVAQAIVSSLTAPFTVITNNGLQLLIQSLNAATFLLSGYNVSSSGGVSDGFYQECGVWERTDAKGQLEQSGPSLTTSFQIQGSAPTVDPAGKLYSASTMLSQVSTGGMQLNGAYIGGNAPFLTTSALWATQKASQLAIYRTTVSPGAPPTFYRVTSAGAAPFNLTNPTGPTQNATNPLTNTSLPQDFLYFLDNSSDATIESNAALYTTGGVLENAPIPACAFLHTHRSRLWGVLTDTLTNQIRYSQPFQPEQQEAVEFCDDLSIDVPQDGSPVVGLATIDDKLIIFSQNKIYWLSGDGPTANGQGDFIAVQDIQSDAGCISAGSIVQTPDGVWFQSAKGFYFIDRNLQVKYMGENVEAFVQGFTCNRAVLMEDRTELRFFMSAIAGAATAVSDFCLTYNYLFNVWSRFTKWAGNAACLWNDQLVWVDSDGNVTGEAQAGTASQYLDNGANVQVLLQTGWLGKSVGLNGYLRVTKASMLGAFQSGHQVQVLVSYDYEPTTQPVYYDAQQITSQQAYAAANFLPVFGANTPYGITDGSAWRFRLFPPVSPRGGRVSAVQFTISDFSDQPNGGGFSLDMLSIELQAFGKLARMGGSRTA